MNHDKSNKAIWTNSEFLLDKIETSAVKKISNVHRYFATSHPPDRKTKKNYFFTNNVGGPEPHLLPPLHNIENLTGKWVKIIYIHEIYEYIHKIYEYIHEIYE